MEQTNWVVQAHMRVTTFTGTECDPAHHMTPPSNSSIVRKIHEQKMSNFEHDYKATPLPFHMAN